MPESVNALEQYYRDLGPATANPNFLAQGRRANVAQRSMPGPTMQAANTQLAKELGSMGDRGAIPDLINRGLIANTAGLPVDLLNTVLQSLGLGAEQPVGGSDSIRRALEYYGLSSNTQRPMFETLAGLTPPKAVMGAARAAGQGAEAVGRAAAPVAGQAVENYLVRSGGVLPMDTWHGSPHRFPPTAKNPLGEFDPMKIGTGEGAQAYGVGAGYLAEAKGLAKGYRERLSTGYLDASNVPKDSGTTWEIAMQAVQNAGAKYPDHARAIASQVQSWVDSGKQAKTFFRYNAVPSGYENQYKAAVNAFSGLKTNSGNLYKVDLADEQIPKMLDWDKPFNKQHPEVQQALVNIANSEDEGSKMLKLMQNGNPSGKDIFRSLLTEPQLIDSPNGWIEVDNKKEISKLLQSEGIPGIRYLDQGSRAGGAGTSNFVVFDPKHMNIIGRE